VILSSRQDKACLIVALLVCGPVLAQQPVPDPAADPADEAAEPGFVLWSDNSVSLVPYGAGFVVDADEQSTFTFEHAHESRIGDLYLFVDSTSFHGAGSGGTTWYGEFGPRLSIGKMLGKDLSHTFFRRSLFEIKDVLLAAQYERGEDPDVAEAILLGVGLDLDVREAGVLGALGKFNFVQLNFYGRSELAEGVDSGFNDMQVTLSASYPFRVGNAHFLVDGFFDWVVGFGSEEWSYHLVPQFTWDAGASWFDVPGKLYVGVRADLWWNKYQIPDSATLDTHQAAPSLLLKYHF
jgi:nucleoside-specific outer membrane channel protein Tsx